MSELVEAIRIRPMRPEDLNFILDGWIRSWRTSPWAGCVPNNMIWEVTRSTVAGLMTRGATIDVAEVDNSEGEPRLVGFICHEGGRYLHYLFVKRNGFRGFGIGSLLLNYAFDEPGIFTHRTPACNWLLNNGWRWDPIPARREQVNHG